MAILVISISLDSSDENVGSSIPSRIILFGTIPAEIPAETPTIPLVVPTLPHTSPFLCIDSSETSSDSFERPPSLDLYEVTVARWRSRVAALSSPPSSPTHDLPPIVRHSLPDSSFSSEDSSFDTRATISARPSRKRCRSPVASVPLATPTLGDLSHMRADLLPPHIDADTTAVETAAALEVGIVIEADVGVEVGIGIEREDEVEEEVESGDRGTIEIGVDRVSDIESA
ncbi:hypothetical protein Tco_0331677 [Tanacetum coccineum]